MFWELDDPHGVIIVIYHVTCGNGVKPHSQRCSEGIAPNRIMSVFFS